MRRHAQHEDLVLSLSKDDDAGDSVQMSGGMRHRGQGRPHSVGDGGPDGAALERGAVIMAWHGGGGSVTQIVGTARRACIAEQPLTPEQ